MDTTDDLAMVLAYRDAPDFDDTAQRNRALLAGALDQIEAGNFEAFWDIYDPEVTFHEASCLPYGGTHRGLAATKAAYAQALAELGHGMMLDQSVPPVKRYPAALKTLRQAKALDPKNKLANEDIQAIEEAYKSLGKPIPK